MSRGTSCFVLGHVFSRKPRWQPANKALLNSLWGRENKYLVIFVKQRT